MTSFLLCGVSAKSRHDLIHRCLVHTFRQLLPRVSKRRQGHVSRILVCSRCGAGCGEFSAQFFKYQY